MSRQVFFVSKTTLSKINYINVFFLILVLNIVLFANIKNVALELHDLREIYASFARLPSHDA